MEEQNCEALVVVDDKGRSLGVVERPQVLSKMLLASTAGSH
jgi:predicted transcriptional regulator